jgi:hypothetical protein
MEYTRALTIPGQLAMLVYMIGYIMNGRIISKADEYDLLDGDLAARVFELLRTHDSHLAQV